MTLLFITRKVDKNDPRAGFVYYWLSKLSSRLDSLIVICQEAGDSSGLPPNIKILPFREHDKDGKLKQLIKFKLLLWYNVRKVDGVMSHMMPLYSILAGPFCKIFRKKLIQWYMHRSVDWRLRLANLFVNEYATASKESFRLRTKKPVHILGHGIEVDIFAPASHPPTPDTFNLLTVGRISPTKDYESMIKAVYELSEQGTHRITLTIVGGIGLPSQQSYLDSLKLMVTNMELTDKVKFIGPVPHHTLPPYFAAADLFLNLSGTGSLDKAVLSAMASQTLVLTSNEAFKPILPHSLMVAKDNPTQLAQSIKSIMSLSAQDKSTLQSELRQLVVDNHNLDKLVERIINLYK